MNTEAQILVPSNNLNADMEFLINIGFKLQHIFPDDSPEVAVMFGHGMNIRLDMNTDAPSGKILILTDQPENITKNTEDLIAPNGTIFNIQQKSYRVHYPPTQHEFEIRQLRDGEPWVIGRAGMLYRDLVPGRLGGGIMASHIRIPEGGPVGDMVHYHTIGFQLIYCYHGWVKLVYEDQGPPFILNAGDCVTQPPEIRHRVLEASDNLEVIEIGVPAEHMTTIDHEMELPTDKFLPEREFNGQQFCHHKVNEATWHPWRISGFEHRDTGVNQASKGVASVHVARPLNNINQTTHTSHNSDILFNFILKGKMNLTFHKDETRTLQKGDAFVMPPKLHYQISDMTKGLEILEVSLPGTFKTTQY